MRFDFRRRCFLGLVAGTGLLGLILLYQALAAARVGPGASAVLALLFVPTFTWIAVSFWHAVIGFVLSLTRRDPYTLKREPPPGRPEAALAPHRTAVVMPIYNEDPAQVAAGLAAMAESLRGNGLAAGFEFFVLSDTRDADRAVQERAVMAGLQQQLGQTIPLHYRQRSDNRGRKAGNVAEFCRRWGRRYEYMVVLDADSLMEARSLAHLVARMQADPDLGLVQSVPLPAGQHSIFARLMQFAAALYSPMLARGQAFWQGSSGNYWGHNAIIRVSAFMACCGLSELPGRPPLGGEITSHDFVEAALLRRAGWKVLLDVSEMASYEEVPANLIDYVRRDRRWMQGNLQHLRLLNMPGLHAGSRLHFLFGAAAYLASVLWLGLLLLGAATMMLHPSAGQADSGVAAAGLVMLIATLLLLFGLRLLGVLLALIQRPQAFGGRVRLLAGVMIEAIAGVLLAPVMMLFHVRFLLEILTGGNAGWSSPPRGDRGLSLREALAHTWSMTLLGLVWLALAFVLAPQYLWWMTPIWLGLLSAPLQAWLSGSRRLGESLRAKGLLLTPQEICPAQVLRHAVQAPPSATSPDLRSPPPECPGPMPAQQLLRPSRRARSTAYGRSRV